MCQFLSAISDGNGRVEFFKVEDIARIMAERNPKNYDWNSHTSIAHYIGLSAHEEDKWNKWEYDAEKCILKEDQVNAENNDNNEVDKKIKEYLKGKELIFLLNLYNRNSGDWNSGNMNSGNSNSGDMNSGDWNSGEGVLNAFCSKRKYILFDEECTAAEYDKIKELSQTWFDLNEWICLKDMSDEEKKDNPSCEITGGYLKKVSYKEAWQKCPSEFIEKVKKLKNFDVGKFEEITGLKV